MASLPDRIASLPQELRDLIFDYACPLLDPAGEAISIDTLYKPPLQLLLNKASREAAADVFYSRSTFSFTSISLAGKWLASLSPEHRDKLQNLRFDPGCAASNPIDLEFLLVCPEQLRFMTLQSMIMQLTGGWAPKKGVILIKMRFMVERGETSVWSDDPIDTLLVFSGWRDQY